MSKLRTTYRICTYGDYGVIERKIINLQCSYKYKIFWIEKIGWETIFSVFEKDLPSVKTKNELLKVMTDLWLKNRKTTLPSRLKSKVIKKLEYSK